jgi:hypothetical protein
MLGWLFAWFRRKRAERLRAAGRTMQAAELRTASPPPARVIAINLGYGLEHWAHFEAEPRFKRRGRYLEGGKLILPGGESIEAACAELGIEIVRTGVRFR